MNQVKANEARLFAMKAHGQQMYGDKPYLYHLVHVEQVACRFGYHECEEVMLGCILHDVVEDTSATVNDLVNEFGKVIGEIVDAVTDREFETKEQVFNLRTRFNHHAVIVKMCDRIANIEACLAEDKSNILNKYLKERELFFDKKCLNGYGVDKKLATYLDEVYSLAQLRVDEEIANEKITIL